MATSRKKKPFSTHIFQAVIYFKLCDEFLLLTWCWSLTSRKPVHGNSRYNDIMDFFLNAEDSFYSPGILEKKAAEQSRGNIYDQRHLFIIPCWYARRSRTQYSAVKNQTVKFRHLVFRITLSLFSLVLLVRMLCAVAARGTAELYMRSIWDDPARVLCWCGFFFAAIWCSWSHPVCEPRREIQIYVGQTVPYSFFRLYKAIHVIDLYTYITRASALIFCWTLL